MHWSWEHFFLAILVALLGWMLYRQIRGDPAAFTKENISRSLFTVGILALGLILFIWILVIFLKAKG